MFNKDSGHKMNTMPSLMQVTIHERFNNTWAVSSFCAVLHAATAAVMFGRLISLSPCSVRLSSLNCAVSFSISQAKATSYPGRVTGWWLVDELFSELHPVCTLIIYGSHVSALMRLLIRQDNSKIITDQ